jgi:hypothetical protein
MAVPGVGENVMCANEDWLIGKICLACKHFFTLPALLVEGDLRGHFTRPFFTQSLKQGGNLSYKGGGYLTETLSKTFLQRIVVLSFGGVTLCIMALRPPVHLNRVAIWLE